MFHRRFPNMKISTFSLRKIYLNNNVVFKQPRCPYRSKIEKRNEIKVQQLDFAQQLKELDEQGQKVIAYTDETTFNLWMKPQKTWIRRFSELSIPISNQRGQSITLVATIAQTSGLINFKIIEGTMNGEEYLQYLKDLNNVCQNKKLKGVLVLDNAKTHHSRACLEYMKLMRLQPMFLPPYSSPLNSIERLWAYIKLKWKKIMIEEEINNNNMKWMLKRLLNSINKETYANFAKSNHKSIAQSLQGMLI